MEKKVKEKYFCNGHTFLSYESVVIYAASINCRVSNTETIAKGKYLITLTSLNGKD